MKSQKAFSYLKNAVKLYYFFLEGWVEWKKNVDKTKSDEPKIKTLEKNQLLLFENAGIASREIINKDYCVTGFIKRKKPSVLMLIFPGCISTIDKISKAIEQHFKPLAKYFHTANLPVFNSITTAKSWDDQFSGRTLKSLKADLAKSKDENLERIRIARMLKTKDRHHLTGQQALPKKARGAKSEEKPKSRTGLEKQDKSFPCVEVDTKNKILKIFPTRSSNPPPKKIPLLCFLYISEALKAGQKGNFLGETEINGIFKKEIHKPKAGVSKRMEKIRQWLKLNHIEKYFELNNDRRKGKKRYIKTSFPSDGIFFL